MEMESETTSKVTNLDASITEISAVHLPKFRWVMSGQRAIQRRLAIEIKKFDKLY